jgi:hypothetical protein
MAPEPEPASPEGVETTDPVTTNYEEERLIILLLYLTTCLY